MTVSPVKQKTFFENAKPTLSNPVFTVDLKKGAPGSYTFGIIDPAQYISPLCYVPVNPARSYWQFSTGGYAIGKQDSFVSFAFDAIADTGTTLLYLPEPVVQAYYAQVPSAWYNAVQGGWTFSCADGLPSISFQIGNHRATAPGSYLLYAPIDRNNSSQRSSSSISSFLDPDTHADVWGHVL